MPQKLDFTITMKLSHYHLNDVLISARHCQMLALDNAKRSILPDLILPTKKAMQFQLKQNISIEKRKQESEKIRSRYPERIPVVVERVHESKIADIEKRKFLVPYDFTMAQFQWIIRRSLTLSAETAIFIFVENTNQGVGNFLNNFKQSWTIPQMTATMGEMYAKHKDEDGFLYIAYSGENAFGY
ncbi:unnamed protein product [Rotaria socialis]|uniref:Autophagy-related protein n=1 Tax=Rotaria socialis TaxID=392032 RepID=A0A820Q245_9BILA|nr:unnamed protein product [Rotaria socialis]